MRKKIKLLFALIVTILFVGACYLIYNMKDEVEPNIVVEEETINDIVIIKKINLESVSNENYYVEFNFYNNETILYKVVKEEKEVREGEVASTIYKQANLYLNDTELENYEKNLNKIYNNPYRYSYLSIGDVKEVINGSNYYYEVDFVDNKYFIYEYDDLKIFDILFE